MLKKLLLALSGALLFQFAAAAVNINTASQAELEALNGIGPAKARAIIDYRQKHGPFKNVNELDAVPGIGAKTMDKLKPDLSISGPTTLPAKAAKPAKPGEKPAQPAAKPASPAASAAAKPQAPAAKPAMPAPATGKQKPEDAAKKP